MLANKFKLWLEWEEYCATQEINHNDDFCNMAIMLEDGSQHFLNVWTYDYFSKALDECKRFGDNLNAMYMQPPDLFVKSLDRNTIEQVVDALISAGFFEK